jgi:cellulose synthase/poly-beta-1,6-N-acetylglucosamine synthase-like glycosyltransferase
MSPDLSRWTHDRVADAPPPLYNRLLEWGFPQAPLCRALAAARCAGVAFEEALYADGEICEAQVVQALSDALGVRVVDAATAWPARGGSSYAKIVAAGMLRLADGRLAAVPRGATLSFLLSARQKARPQCRLALVSRQDLIEIAIDVDRENVADTAAFGLLRRQPRFAAAASLLRWQITAALVLAGCGLLASLVWDVAATRPLEVVACAFFLAITWLRLAAVGAPIDPGRPRRRVADHLLPVYTILVPLCREDAAVAGLIASLSRLDYPRVKLDVKFLVEEDDEVTFDALAAIGVPGWIEIVPLPRGKPRTKPRALNVGLATARGSYLVVYDTEDRPDPRQLRQALACFARHCPLTAVVQARLRIDDDQYGFWPTQFRMEYAGLFGVLVPALAAFRLPVPLGGTSNHFRTALLVRMGGWDAFNVTEDAEIGMRLFRLGYATETIVSQTEEEAPSSCRAWLRQRTRWMKGWMITLLVHSRSPKALVAEFGPRGAAGFVLLTGGTVICALLEPVCLAILSAKAISGLALPTPSSLGDALLLSAFLVSFVLGHAAFALLGICGLHRSGRRISLGSLLGLPLYWLALSLAAWWALAELIIAPHHWAKTRHFMTRMPVGASTSRREDEATNT